MPFRKCPECKERTTECLCDARIYDLNAKRKAKREAELKKKQFEESLCQDCCNFAPHCSCESGPRIVLD